VKAEATGVEKEDDFTNKFISHYHKVMVTLGSTLVLTALTYPLFLDIHKVHPRENHLQNQG
jgi:hypothetical protein